MSRFTFHSSGPARGSRSAANETAREFTKAGRITGGDHVARAVWALLAGALVALIMGVAGPVPPAAAHTGLVSSNPAVDAQLTTPPARLQLTFADKVTPGFADVALTVDGGSSVSLRGEVNGAVVTATPHPGGNGRVWKVAYRVVPADGHPISGKFAFTVTPNTPTPTPRSSAAGPSAGPVTASLMPATSRQPADAPVTDIHRKRKYGWIVSAGVALLMLVPVAGALYGVGRPQRDHPVSDAPAAEEPPAVPPEQGEPDSNVATSVLPAEKAEDNQPDESQRPLR